MDEMKEYKDEIRELILKNKSIPLRLDTDFITQWIVDNITEFIDCDNYPRLKQDLVNDLLIVTSNYKNAINNKKTKEAFNNFSKAGKQGKKTIQELIDKNKPKLKQVYEDLTFNMPTGKGEQLRSLIKEFIDDPKPFFPIIKTKSHANNNELRQYLQSLKLSKIAVKEYLNYFKPHK
jgi:methionyl-tRNA synthetase